MLRKRTHVPYWNQFQKYQTFADFNDLKETVSLFEKEYVLTKSMQGVLNTLKLHAKNFVGVCWLFREEISKKSGYSTSSVDRAIEAFTQAGLLKVIHWMNDKRGGQSHNIYVIQDLYGLNDQASGEANDEAPDEANDEASTTPEHASNPCGSKVSEVATHPYKNFNRDFDKNSNTNSNTKDKINTFEKDELLGDQSFKVEMEKESDLQQQQQKAEFEKEVMLMHIPAEFVTIMNPFYGNRPEIILERWKSVSVAVKRSCLNMSNTSWETIDEAWKVTVNKFKRGLIKDAKTATTQSEIDKAIGGYFYGVLCDYLLNDFLMANAFGAQTA